MEYYAGVCFLSAVFTSRCIGKIRHIKFSNASRSKYSQQETHSMFIFICPTASSQIQLKPKNSVNMISLQLSA